VGTGAEKKILKHSTWLVWGERESGVGEATDLRDNAITESIISSSAMANPN